MNINKFHTENFDVFKNTLKQNNYPLRYIYHTINRRIHKLILALKIYLLDFPVMCGKLTKLILKALNLTPAWYYFESNSLYTALKDSIHKLSQSEVVYKLTCQNCISC